MTETVERVARALSIADGMHPEARSNDDDEIPMWTLYVGDARAALAEIRAIFDERANAAEFEADRDYELHTAVAMIDEALK